MANNILYGTAHYGGSSGNGTVFALNTDGTDFKILHSFTALSSSYINSDGAWPNSVIVSGNTLYGTTERGGSSGAGTVFAVNTDGTGFTNLYSLLGPMCSSNGDGANPRAGLVSWGNTLYGTTQGGGSGCGGTVFALNSDGAGFKTLYSFSNGGAFTNSDGNVPLASLVLCGNGLYGTASGGGIFGGGTVFSVFVLPQLTITPSSSDIILAWPTNATGFNLQSTRNVASPSWTVISTAPVIVNGQNIVTNPISGTQQFFRLAQ